MQLFLQNIGIFSSFINVSNFAMQKYYSLMVSTPLKFLFKSIAFDY